MRGLLSFRSASTGPHRTYGHRWKRPPVCTSTYRCLLTSCKIYPTKGVTADETAKCIFQHLGRFGAPERILTDRGTAFHNELVSELIHMSYAEHELTIAYSKEENAIVEWANQEVIRHLRALLFDKHVYNKWSFEKLPLVQCIMNTVEKTATGVTPAELILNNSVRWTKGVSLNHLLWTELDWNRCQDSLILGLVDKLY